MLAAKQETLAMRVPFKHKYGEGIVLYAETGNALVPDTLIVAATVPLDKSSKGYDAGKIAELKAEISAFTHKHNITKLVLTQGEVSAHRP
jgi:hypothetical protein